MPDSLPLALLAADWLRSPAALAVGLACVALVAFLLFLVLFEPGLAYRVEAPEAPLRLPRLPAPARGPGRRPGPPGQPGGGAHRRATVLRLRAGRRRRRRADRQRR